MAKKSLIFSCEFLITKLTHKMKNGQSHTKKHRGGSKTGSLLPRHSVPNQARSVRFVTKCLGQKNP